MKPLGRKPTRFPGKVDNHPPKGWSNWWEDDMGTYENKTASRQAGKKDIENQLMEMEEKEKVIPVVNRLKIGQIYRYTDLQGDDPDMEVEYAGVHYDDKSHLWYHHFVDPETRDWNLTSAAWNDVTDHIKEI